MAKVYANLVYHGVKTIDQVPQKLRLAVEALLEQMQKNNHLTSTENVI